MRKIAIFYFSCNLLLFHFSIAQSLLQPSADKVRVRPFAFLMLISYGNNLLMKNALCCCNSESFLTRQSVLLILFDGAGKLYDNQIQ